MKAFVVRWTEVAVEDLASILAFVADESVERAQEILSRIEERADGLCRFPQRGKVVSGLRWHGISSFRQLVVKPWRVVYRVDGRAVVVHAVVDGRRNLEDLLLERVLRA